MCISEALLTEFCEETSGRVTTFKTEEEMGGKREDGRWMELPQS
jgi:hypothetical protein